MKEGNATKKAYEETNNAASHVKHRTLIFSKLHIILCSYMHNIDLINIIVIPVRVERDYVAPTIAQREGTRVKQRGEGDSGHRRTCRTFVLPELPPQRSWS